MYHVPISILNFCIGEMLPEYKPIVVIVHNYKELCKYSLL